MACCCACVRCCSVFGGRFLVQAQDANFVLKTGITHVLNVTMGAACPFKHVEYMQVKVKDVEETDLLPHLAQGQTEPSPQPSPQPNRNPGCLRRPRLDAALGARPD